LGHDIPIDVVPVHVLLSYRHDARIVNAANLNCGTVVSDVGMGEGSLGHGDYLVHKFDNVRRCHKALALWALFCCVLRIFAFIEHTAEVHRERRAYPLIFALMP